MPPPKVKKPYVVKKIAQAPLLTLTLGQLSQTRMRLEVWFLGEMKSMTNEMRHDCKSMPHEWKFCFTMGSCRCETVERRRLRTS